MNPEQKPIQDPTKNAHSVRRFVGKHPACLTEEGETIPADSPFWAFYRDRKQALYEQGLFVFKATDGSWRVRWMDPTNRAQELKEKNERWLTRLSACGCVHYFDDMVVTVRTLKNGTVRYDWRCPVCKRTERTDGQMSEPLPHSLIPELEKRGCRVVEVGP